MIERIKEIIEEQGLSKKCRKQNLVHKRAYLFNLIRKHGVCYREIGELFNLSHASVIHGCSTAQLHESNNDKLYFLDTIELQKEFGDVEVITEERDLIEDIENCNTMYQLLIIKGRLKNNQYLNYNNIPE